MAKMYQLFFGMVLVMIMQSCYIRQRPNMRFVDKSVIGEDTEVMAMKVPMFLVKPFVKKELEDEENGVVMSNAINKIKGVKMTMLSNAEHNDRIRTDFKKFLKKERMEEFAAINSDGDHISINGRMRKDKIKKLMLGISSSDGEHIFVEVKGNFTMEDISNAIKTYDKNDVNIPRSGMLRFLNDPANKHHVKAKYAIDGEKLHQVPAKIKNEQLGSLVNIIATQVDHSKIDKMFVFDLSDSNMEWTSEIDSISSALGMKRTISEWYHVTTAGQDKVSKITVNTYGQHWDDKYLVNPLIDIGKGHQHYTVLLSGSVHADKLLQIVNNLKQVLWPQQYGRKTHAYH